MNYDRITEAQRLTTFHTLFELSQLGLGNEDFFINIMKDALSDIIDMFEKG